MNKLKAIEQVYRIGTLTEPSEATLRLLASVDFERVLELLLMMRMSERPVRNQEGYLKRAIEEGWTAVTLPQKIDRKLENTERRYYERRGYTTDEAQKKVVSGRGPLF